MSREINEKLKIVFSEGFNSDEIEEITESFSKIVPVEKRYFRTASVERVAAVLIIFMLGFVTREISEGFFKAMGSDLYRIAKEKVIRILKKKQNPTLMFKMFYRGTEISIICQTKDEREMIEVFNTIDKARDVVINELDKKEIPKMTEIYTRYDKGWTLDWGRKGIKSYKYDKKTGKWQS